MKKFRELIQKLLAQILKHIAVGVLKKYKPTIIGVTGNVGKTTTKDVIKNLLEPHVEVGATIRSQNSDLTTPLSIFNREVQSKERNPFVWFGHIWAGLSLVLFSKEFPKVLVLEISAGAPGDITRQTSWIKPDISVITALQEMPVHVEFFENREQLFHEKMQIAVYTKQGGPTIYNNTDLFTKELLPEYTDNMIGVGEDTDISINSIVFDSQGTEIKLAIQGTEMKAFLPGVWGRSYGYSLLLGIAILQELGYDIETSLVHLGETFVPMAGRMRVLRNIADGVLVDDSYSASPAAVNAALETFKDVDTPNRKIFIFGDMSELGEYTEQAHIDIGRISAEFCDVLITVGEVSNITQKAAIENGMDENQTKHFSTSDEAGMWVAQELQQGDYVLAKSSRHAIKMEQALRHIVTPEDKKHLWQEYL